MCEVIRRRKSKKFVYLDIIDGEMYQVKKMSLPEYEYAKNFRNADLLNAISRQTKDRDFHDAFLAKEFVVAD